MDHPTVSPAETQKRHVCGWARQGDVWLCVQDFYAVGYSQMTACGNHWPTKSPDNPPSRPMTEERK